MVTAIILISVERDLILDVIDEILKVDGIMEVHSVAGEYDLAAIARVEDNQQLSMILADKMCHQIKGITHTKTLISLGSYYNFDVNAAFPCSCKCAAKAAPAKKNSAAPTTIPAITMGCRRVRRRLKKPQVVILSHRSS